MQGTSIAGLYLPYLLNTTIKLYQAQVIPILDYVCIVWRCTSTSYSYTKHKTAIITIDVGVAMCTSLYLHVNQFLFMKVFSLKSLPLAIIRYLTQVRQIDVKLSSTADFRFFLKRNA